MIKTAAVLGAGTMGAQIAGHAANAGLLVLLLDVTVEQAQAGLKALQKSSPTGLFVPEKIHQISLPVAFECRDQDFPDRPADAVVVDRDRADRGRDVVAGAQTVAPGRGRGTPIVPKAHPLPRVGFRPHSHPRPAPGVLCFPARPRFL